jgi:cilia- and flagella-associated protein 57
LVYAAGHNIILYQLDARVQRFLPGSNDSDKITAVAVSPNRKLLCVAERAEKATIAVYDLQSLKRRKTLTSTETLSKVRHPSTPSHSASTCGKILTCIQEYVSLDFSPDGKVLVAQGGAPDWNLIVWVWEKSKVVASTRTTNQNSNPVHQVSSDSIHISRSV